MLIYVCAKAEQQNERDRARDIMQALARDLENTYICSAFAFSYLTDCDEADREIMRADLICVCDKLLIATDLDEDMRRDIDFAQGLKIPIEHI